ncbi:hypothetical protein AK812_SmicGene9398 [Symbiodinium microadriaticum]|uniref:Uncharacterized protein n=1 Tax=Symbiodinium microadriaticum TaxID=2951 RepID=A0A1Q9EIK5_SYMMI|nr:hypothetical protein AK812_SmicGene9398 [Symbiodinium microadriaticum]
MSDLCCRLRPQIVRADFMQTIQEGGHWIHKAVSQDPRAQRTQKLSKGPAMWSATRWPIDRNYARLQAAIEARGRTNLIFVDTAAISMYRSDRRGS